MKLIDEVKKLRDECRKEEEYHRKRFEIWTRHKGVYWCEEQAPDGIAWQSVAAIRSNLDRIIDEYKQESPVQLGYWEPISPEIFYNDHYYYKCSECGAVSDHKSAYCPNCGAEMSQEAEDEAD